MCTQNEPTSSCMLCPCASWVCALALCVYATSLCSPRSSAALCMLWFCVCGIPVHRACTVSLLCPCACCAPGCNASQCMLSPCRLCVLCPMHTASLHILCVLYPCLRCTPVQAVCVLCLCAHCERCVPMHTTWVLNPSARCAPGHPVSPCMPCVCCVPVHSLPLCTLHVCCVPVQAVYGLYLCAHRACCVPVHTTRAVPPCTLRVRCVSMHAASLCTLCALCPPACRIPVPAVPPRLPYVSCDPVPPADRRTHAAAQPAASPHPPPARGRPRAAPPAPLRRSAGPPRPASPLRRPLTASRPPGPPLAACSSAVIPPGRTTPHPPRRGAAPPARLTACPPPCCACAVRRRGGAGGAAAPCAGRPRRCSGLRGSVSPSGEGCAVVGFVKTSGRCFSGFFLVALSWLLYRQVARGRCTGAVSAAAWKPLLQTQLRSLRCCNRNSSAGRCSRARRVQRRAHPSGAKCMQCTSHEDSWCKEHAVHITFQSMVHAVHIT